MGDQARALVRAWWAAIGVCRDSDHNEPAILHGRELPAQQIGLRSGLPGMRHALGRSRAVTRQRIPAEVYTGRQYQPVIGDARSLRRGRSVRLRIDTGYRQLG
jgi:hypothetical protein